MQTSIDLPQSFSVRDENEFFPIQHLMSRLNPKLTVTRITTGRHVHGGPDGGLGTRAPRRQEAVDERRGNGTQGRRF